MLFAGDEFQQTIIKEYFPSIQTFDLAAYPFTFTKDSSFTVDLYKSRNVLMKHVRYEYNEVQTILKNNPTIDLVLSDHRYGVYSTSVPSFFITHQVKLAVKWYQFPAQYIHNVLMSPFNKVLIMDDAENRLAGKLSAAPQRKDYQYIGHYSRFDVNQAEKTLEVGVVNGPLPYSEQLFEALLEKKELDKIVVSEHFYYKSLDSRLVNAVSWKQADEVIVKAQTIHAYCGYSTLMDIKVLGCKGELKPTPGQLEQEYLFKLNY